MILVVDKKVVKHLVETSGGMLEIPVRVKFEYCVEEQQFVDGSMKRDVLYNRQAVKRHFPRIDLVQLDHDITATVDRSLEESLRYEGHASGKVALYPAADPPEEDREPPQILLPGDA